MQKEGEQSWMSLYIEYLEVGKLLEDKVEAQKVTTKAANY